MSRSHIIEAPDNDTEIVVSRKDDSVRLRIRYKDLWNQHEMTLTFNGPCARELVDAINDVAKGLK